MVTYYSTLYSPSMIIVMLGTVLLYNMLLQTEGLQATKYKYCDIMMFQAAIHILCVGNNIVLRLCGVNSIAEKPNLSSFPFQEFS